MDHECCDCLWGEYIELDIDVWGWTCGYCHFPNEEECNEIYEDDKRM